MTFENLLYQFRGVVDIQLLMREQLQDVPAIRAFIEASSKARFGISHACEFLALLVVDIFKELFCCAHSPSSPRPAWQGETEQLQTSAGSKQSGHQKHHSAASISFTSTS